MIIELAHEGEVQASPPPSTRFPPDPNFWQIEIELLGEATLPGIREQLVAKLSNAGASASQEGCERGSVIPVVAYGGHVQVRMRKRIRDPNDTRMIKDWITSGEGIDIALHKEVGQDHLYALLRPVGQARRNIAGWGRPTIYSYGGLVWSLSSAAKPVVLDVVPPPESDAEPRPGYISLGEKTHLRFAGLLIQLLSHYGDRSRPQNLTLNRLKR